MAKSRPMSEGMKYNRTGIQTAPKQGKQMVEGAQQNASRAPRGVDARELREPYLREARPLGSVPPPATAKGVWETAKGVLSGDEPTVFVDKIAERLAFERTGTRLYESLIDKLKVQGGFEGGPREAELQQFHDEELRHFHLLEETLEELGADPTAVTPSADLAAVESSGISQVVGDPRASLADGLHAILVAELVDKDGWDLLVELAEGLGFEEIAERFRAADREEERHLASVRRWVQGHTTGAAGATRSAA